jgi:phosphoenolpyruvate carboxykinase (ATP)
VAYENHKVFELQNHKAVQMYQVKYLRNTWEDPALYDIKAAELAKFKANLPFEEFANAEIMAGAPNA